MGSLRTWLFVAPILVAGLFVGHELAYRLAIVDPHEREEALASAGHGYFAYGPYLGAFVVACAIVAAASRVRRAYSGRSDDAPSWGFALLPPLGFVLLEVLERMGGHHGLEPATVAAPEFLLGLALQLPFAIAALVLARLLASVTETVGRALRQAWSPRLLRPSPLSLVPTATPFPRLSVAGLAYGARGPPSLA